MSESKSECYPAPCTCCECRGVMCYRYHEGHTHRDIHTTKTWLEFAAEVQAVLRAVQPEDEKHEDR